GGTSEYPNHYLMKKNRLIILLHNPICEICKKNSAVEIHHKDFSRDNHNLSNLQAVCHSCHPRRLRVKIISIDKVKIIRDTLSSEIHQRYGMTVKDIATKLNRSQGFVVYWHKYSVNRLSTLLSKG
ncbi:MAG: HNH endonuclease signature motif containing protein, partial [Planctomycetota bacterium]